MNDNPTFQGRIPAEVLLEDSLSEDSLSEDSLSEDSSEIRLPSEEEKNEAIKWILDTAMPQENGIWKTLYQTANTVGLRTLFFGVGDCFFLALLVLCVCLMPAAAVLVRMVRMAPCLFLVSPSFYALAHLLTMWKEYQIRTLEWKRTWRIPYQTVMALRMLVFGAVSVAVSVLLCVLLWAMAGQMVSFVWMLSVAFSSLFLYGGSSLLCQRALGMRAAAVLPVIWIAAGLVPVVWEAASVWLMQIPVFVFGLTAVAGGVFYLSEIAQFSRRGLCQDLQM